MMTNEVIINSEAFKNIRSQWNDLIHNYDKHCTPFQTWEWNYNWWTHFGVDKNLRVITRKKDGNLVSIMPFWIKKYDTLYVLELLGTRGSDYLDILDATNDTKTSINMLLQLYINEDIDVINIEDIPETSNTIMLLRTISQQYGLHYNQEVWCPCYSINLPRTWEDYLLSLSKRKRRDVLYDRRYMKSRIKNVEYRKAGADFFQDHIWLHQKRQESLGHNGSYHLQSTIKYMQNIVNAFDENGVLNLTFVCVDGQPIASVLSVLMGRTNFAITLGFDPMYKKLSPGSAVLGWDIQAAIQRQLRGYDLSRGYDGYKASWNAQPTRNLRLLISKNRASIARFKAEYNKKTTGIGFAPCDF